MARQLCCCAIVTSFAMVTHASRPASTAAAGDPARTHPAIENLVGLAVDTGYGPDRSGATSIGGRFLRVRWHLSTPPGAARWVGYGADAQVITVGFDSLDAGLAQLVVVAGAGTHAGVGVQFEAAVGGATGDATLPFAAVGAFFAPLPYFAIGFSAREPLVGARPEWLEAVQVGGRVVLPIDP